MGQRYDEFCGGDQMQVQRTEIRPLMPGTKPEEGPTEDFQRAGDEARARRDWVSAARAYGAHVAAFPEDAPIWVQLGHALKEQGALQQAERAYRRAVLLRPEDADAQLQLGRALHLRGGRAEAVQALRKALELARLPEAYRELVALGEGELAAELMDAWAGADGTSAILFEISDLFVYLRAHKTPSGIQRVQANIVSQMAAMRAEVPCCRFVISKASRLWALSPEEVLRYSSGTAVDHGRLRALIDEAEALATPVRAARGQTLVVLGAFWHSPEVLRNASRLRTEGVRIGALVYDLIPITHPEFCDAGLTTRFVLAFGDGLRCFDYVLTISEHVAREVRLLLDRAGLSATPVDAVPLAHSFGAPSRGTAAPRWTPAISVLRDQKFVLSVSTIEARKNHAYLFRAWREMLAAGDDVPDLVFVGRPGWRVGDLMAQLRDTGHLDGRIHVLHDLSDDELATLYRSCLFTAFPSFVEGWGLPVGESLSHGAPCVASSAASIPEVGGEFADYVDPLNLREGVAAFRRLLFEPGYLEHRRAAIADRFRSRDWRQVAESMLEAIARRPARGPAETVVALAPGHVFAPAMLSFDHRPPSDYLERPTRPILADGWQDCDSGGAWMRGQEALLVFRTGRADGEEAVVLLEIVGAPHAAGQALSVAQRNAPRRQPWSGRNDGCRVVLRSGANVTARVRARAGMGGLVELQLSLDRAVPASSGDDPHGPAAGLVRLAWAPMDDIAGRQEITEQFLFEQPPA